MTPPTLEDVADQGTTFGRMLRDRTTYREAVRRALIACQCGLWLEQIMSRADAIYEDLKRDGGGDE